MKIRIKSLSGKYPAFETEGAAGMDISAFLDAPVTIDPWKRYLVPTGLFMAIDRGFEVQIRARSGLAVHHGICLANGVGTIDSDYRGEVLVVATNRTNELFALIADEKIAQLVFVKKDIVELEQVEEITNDTNRGTGGFGSTGRF